MSPQLRCPAPAPNQPLPVSGSHPLQKSLLETPYLVLRPLAPYLLPTLNTPNSTQPGSSVSHLKPKPVRFSQNFLFLHPTQLPHSFSASQVPKPFSFLPVPDIVTKADLTKTTSGPRWPNPLSLLHPHVIGFSGKRVWRELESSEGREPQLGKHPWEIRL